jgi:hypothetical protein
MAPKLLISAFRPLHVPRQQLNYPQFSRVASYTTNMSTSTTNQPNNASTPQESQPGQSTHTPNTPQNTENKTPLPLPAPSSENTTKLDMSTGSSTVKLDHLGPLVVNKDGTLSRIANWEQMAEIEKSNTLRILGKRNMLRREALQNAEDEGAK